MSHPTLHLVLAAALVALPGGAVAADPPRVVIEQTTSMVLDVLGDHALSSADKRRRIEGVVYARVDFDVLSRLVMAQNWDRLSPPQKTAFLEEFRRHLSVTYGKRLESYRNERVEITGERDEARGDHTVKTKILRGGPDDILVDYRLRRTGDRWLIIDFIIEGVSLVANYRSQFQEIMGNGGANHLIELLREKNASGEPLKS